MSRVVNVDSPNIPKRKSVPLEQDIKTWVLSLLDRTRQGLTQRVECGDMTGVRAGHHMDCVVAVANIVYQFYNDQRVLDDLHIERNELYKKVQGLEVKTEELEEELAILRTQPSQSVEV